MKQFLLLIVFTVFSLLSCGNDSHNETDSDTDNKPTVSDFFVSSYLRGNFYNDGRISTASLNACNDIICIGATPNADGNLSFDSFELHKGQDVSTYPELITAIKAQLTGNTTLRFGISGGNYWKEMVANDAAITTFVQNVTQTIESLALDGVDLDFEWASSQQEYDNYSKLIVELGNALQSNTIFSVTLDPISYQINSNAIAAVTYLSLQCYGPSPIRFSYDNYVSSLQKLIDYGVPAHKIVAGLPFYGVTADDSRKSVAYYALVTDGLINSPTTNEVTYNGESYVFNGQSLIQQKVKYALSQGFYGVMSWSLGTDVDYSNQWSLLKAINNIIEQE